MFMGYEWQGAGKDGDHNIFFLNNNNLPVFPMRYEELVKKYSDEKLYWNTSSFSLSIGT